MPQHPMRPLPAEWTPTSTQMSSLTAEFGHLISIPMSLRRFRNHYAEGQTSRNWEAKFENWVLSDYQRAGAEAGTDSMGIPHSQRKTSVVQPARSGDPDFVDMDELIDSITNPKEDQ